MRLIVALALLAVAAGAQPLPFTGVNLAGGEFYGPKRGERPTYGTNFVYPGNTDYAYFAWHGANLFRVPFRWETIQPEAGGELDAEMLGRLVHSVELATNKGYYVLLDPHNYARYYGDLIGSETVSSADFADFWVRLAGVFGSNPRVWFGLVNEPNGISAAAWFDIAAEAVTAIRAAGATNLILLPGTAYSGAHSWQSDWYGGANAAAVGRVVDPLDHMILEVHQYFDGDSSGTKDEVVSPTIGSERVAGFVDWCRANGYRALLGEFGLPRSPEGQATLADLMASMERDRDVWIGWTWWAAGSWWPEDYVFLLQPKPGEKPQMSWLLPHLSGDRKPTVTLTIAGVETRELVCGDQVTLTAPAPPAGRAFGRWTGDVAWLADAAAAETTLTVPYRNLTLGLVWE